jgi:hypothetical protein
MERSLAGYYSYIYTAASRIVPAKASQSGSSMLAGIMCFNHIKQGCVFRYKIQTTIGIQEQTLTLMYFTSIKIYIVNVIKEWFEPNKTYACYLVELIQKYQLTFIQQKKKISL